MTNCRKNCDSITSRLLAQTAASAIALASTVSMAQQAAPVSPQVQPQQSVTQPIAAQPGGVQPNAVQSNAGQPSASQPNAGQPSAGQPSAVRQVAANGQNGAVQQAAPRQPFPALTPQQQAELEQVLLAWQKQSQATKTLECQFTHWKYDLRAAPAGIHAKKGLGVIKYANPDKGLLRTDTLLIFQGMKDGKPQFGKQPDQFGDYWVCNGVEVISYDRTEEKCTVLALPKEMQGTKIFNSPLPFVFNSDVAEIKERFWIRMLPPNKQGTILLEAWPKRQKDRAQYKAVQVALNAAYEPVGLVMYAPNFHAQNAPEWEVFEFTEVQRNGKLNSIRNFMGDFIPKRPPANWEIDRQELLPDQIANQPAGTPVQR